MTDKSLAVVILAAGKGTRMKSDHPKVMHPVAGLPMLSHILHTAESLEPKHIVVVAGPDMPQIHHLAAKHSVVVQRDRLGTADAVKAALPALKGFKGNVLILLGDAPLLTIKTIKSLIKARQSEPSVGLSVLGTQLDDPKGYGRLIMSGKSILEKIVEEKDASKDEKAVQLVNTGAFCVDAIKLGFWIKKIKSNNAQGEYYVTDLPQIAAKEGFSTKVAVTNDPTEVIGCNSRADLAVLETIMQNRLRAQAMAKGVTMIDPSSVYLCVDTKIGKDVLIEPNVFIGPNVEISSGAHIKAFTHLEGAKIGKDVSVGPFARVRPDSEIADGARIGNFVEIKKSKIGKGSKIGHLAYVGDCLMGDDVNFSAGAITVNYDGFEKHQTVIGKGVMVGSNVNLVAPLSIDNGAFIAAGSTITEDVPADALSIAREVHNIREGWALEYRKKKEAVLKKLKGKKKAS